MVLIVVVVLLVLVGAWMEVVSPERQEASKLSAQVGTAKSELASAEAKLASARAAQSQYASAYAAMVSLGKAVPASQEVPSLIYELAQASNQKRVEFASIGSSTSAPGSSGATAVAASAASGFTPLPFTLTFEGSFFDLEHLFQQLTSFTTRTTTGTLQVSGRLLTIQSVKLAPVSSAGSGTSTDLTGSVTASAYVAPATQGLSSGATAASPTGAASPASSSAPASSATAPAIVRVNP